MGQFWPVFEDEYAINTVVFDIRTLAMGQFQEKHLKKKKSSLFMALFDILKN